MNADELRITLTGETARAVRITADLLGMAPGELAAAMVEGGEVLQAAYGDAADFENFCERFALDATEARAVAQRAAQYFERRFTVEPHPYGPSFVPSLAERGQG